MIHPKNHVVQQAHRVNAEYYKRDEQSLVILIHGDAILPDEIGQDA
jgi:hypothetical protein